MKLLSRWDRARGDVLRRSATESSSKRGTPDEWLGGDGHGIDDQVWQSAVDGLPLLTHLDSAERARLRTTAGRFLKSKKIVTKHDLEPDAVLQALIAVQICLPVLQLGLSYYRDWHTVIVYPEGFLVPRDQPDEDGVVHCGTEALAGEAWERGPLVLSWHDVLCRGDGFNVVIHECAHKLDMLNGAVNGFPPLHAEMDRVWWSRVFRAAYDDFGRRVEQSAATADGSASVPFDVYAADSPGEFFAVLSEAFFELPQQVRAVYPQVYRQLQLFYRQDPLLRPG